MKAQQIIDRCARGANAINDPRDRLAWQVGALQGEIRNLCEEITPTDPFGLSSVQPLGESFVTVWFYTEGDRRFPDIAIDAACVNGARVDADCFSADVLETWREAIRREVEQRLEEAA